MSISTLCNQITKSVVSMINNCCYLVLSHGAAVGVADIPRQSPLMRAVISDQQRHNTFIVCPRLSQGYKRLCMACIYSVHFEHPLHGLDLMLIEMHIF